MAAKRGGLSRGLEALLPDILGNKASAQNTNVSKVKNSKITNHNGSAKRKSKSVTSNELLDLNNEAVQDHNDKNTNSVNNLLYWDIKNLEPSRFQPRRDILDSDLESLAESIKSQGILQPLVIRDNGKGKGEIIAGERRWRAATLAGLAKVPVIVKDIPDRECMAIALIENVQRENLNPIDEALAVERLVQEFDLTHAEIAKLLGKSRTVITNLLRLLTLPKEVKILLENGDIEAGHAKVLLGLPTSSQAPAARVVVAKGLSVRETEALVVRMLAANNKSDSEILSKSKKLDPDIKRLRESLSDTLGTKVDIQHGRKGKGKVVLYYNDLDELEGILNHIN